VRIAAISAVFGALVASAGAASTQPAMYEDPVWSPDGGRIAFASTRDDPNGYLRIYVMNADGSGTHRVTDDAAEAETAPSWSPNGRKIAFQSYASVDVINADGSGRRRVVSDVSCCGPDWSPKGRRIAYNWYNEFVARVYVVKPDGSGNQLVAAPSPKQDCYSYGGPTWSPDGERLAFRAGTAADCMPVQPFVGIVSQYRGKVRRLMRGHLPWSLDWGPNGRTILVAENGRISLLDVRTGRVRLISRQDTFGAHWSPNGRRIIFASRSRIYVMNADGSNVRELVPH
jgi:Tol biopolymer transport system component